MLSKYIKNIFVYAIFIGFVSLLPLLLTPFKGLMVPETWLLVVSLVTGMLYVYALMPYFKALSMEEVSRVVPLWRFNLCLF